MLSGGGKTTFVSGPAGPPNTLTVRSVTTGVPGSQAAAQINGVSPNQTLDLTIPQGQPGATGAVPWAPIVAWYANQICTAAAPATLVYVGGTAYVCALSHIAGTFAADLAAGKWAPVAPAGLQPWQTPPVPWAASTAYTATAPASCVTYGGGCYVCATAHTSGASFDLTKWIQIAAPGQAPGALQAVNNLSDVASVGQSLANLKQAPSLSSTTTALAVTDFDRPLFLTGSPTITMPNGGAGWRTEVIKNANLVAGLVTMAVPPGASLDGVTNGTRVLFPYQRARIIQTGVATYVTDWVDRTPLLGEPIIIPSTAPVASVNIALPVAYGEIEIEFHDLMPSTNAVAFYYRLTNDGFSTLKAGASDYAYTSIFGNNGSVGNGNGSYAQGYLTAYGVNTGSGMPPVMGVLKIAPGNSIVPSANNRPMGMSEAFYINTAGNQTRDLIAMSCASITDRANGIQIFAMSTGTNYNFCGAFVARARP